MTYIITGLICIAIGMIIGGTFRDVKCYECRREQMHMCKICMEARHEQNPN